MTSQSGTLEIGDAKIPVIYTMFVDPKRRDRFERKIVHYIAWFPPKSSEGAPVEDWGILLLQAVGKAFDAKDVFDLPDDVKASEKVNAAFLRRVRDVLPDGQVTVPRSLDSKGTKGGVLPTRAESQRPDVWNTDVGTLVQQARREVKRRIVKTGVLQSLSQGLSRIATALDPDKSGPAEPDCGQKSTNEPPSSASEVDDLQGDSSSHPATSKAPGQPHVTSARDPGGPGDAECAGDPSTGESMEGTLGGQDEATDCR